MSLMSLRLIIEDDEGSTTVVPLGQDPITIGRHEGNTIRLTEKNVSRRHARLFPEGEGFALEDLGSYNGVKVNGRTVAGKVHLREGDVVQIGDYHLALTEDVDRCTLNYDPPRAANDAEPLLASSSTQLPRLTADELASMSSGGSSAGQPVTPSAGMPADSGRMPADSGRVPASTLHRGTTQSASRAGWFVLFAVVLLVGATAGGYLWLRESGRLDSGAVVATATPSTDDNSKRGAALAGPPIPAPEPSPTPAPAPADDPPSLPAEGQVQAPPGEAPSPMADEAAPNTADEGRGSEELVEPEPEPAPTRTARPKSPPSGSHAAKKPEPPAPAPSVAPSPPAPEVDVDALLADARKEMFKNPNQAYQLAFVAYGAQKSQDAAALMAVAACRMKDAGRARKAINKLRGGKREQAAQVCASNGIVLE